MDPAPSYEAATRQSSPSGHDLLDTLQWWWYLQELAGQGLSAKEIAKTMFLGPDHAATPEFELLEHERHIQQVLEGMREHGGPLGLLNAGLTVRPAQNVPVQSSGNRLVSVPRILLETLRSNSSPWPQAESDFLRARALTMLAVGTGLSIVRTWVIDHQESPFDDTVGPGHNALIATLRAASEGALSLAVHTAVRSSLPEWKHWWANSSFRERLLLTLGRPGSEQ
ncbi:hypothetical protein TREMEDRAFT_58990 [Tremella mesenterica DSM 1558]|uniref:uncharacterized protein n=1 Tax=Tremella mesenterica (strain ATCC 24925 / CBS 8224 / DSM 1558 / NBRC 9311 / NRRL Y-6157 / RJB 2259-6 / UBC 559-6) TaxID=578456 RepID=UPI0003F49453|nr:uncharacterized protein TREMEDRAFT_58990 [Tremella mesenterica DSM 1558]EIW72822.1 hypothetical protein TREMEDRAFT_58990 [Tremella mesenterica DSM 1558]